MGRKDPFMSFVKQAARSHARHVRESHRASVAAARQQERAARERARNAKAAARQAAKDAVEEAKEAKLRYLESRQDAVEELNQDTATRVTELADILSHTLAVDDKIEFAELRINTAFPDFSVPAKLAHAPRVPEERRYLDKVSSPGFLARLLPGASARHGRALAKARQDYEEANSIFAKEKAIYDRALAEAVAEHKREQSAFEKKAAERNAEVDSLEQGYISGDTDSVITYCSMVLERSEYPDGFSQEFRVAYVPESKELVVEYELPSSGIVPVIADYRYIKSKDEIEEKPRKPADIRSIYEDVVLSICLRTLHEIFEADYGGNVLVLAFNGFVQAVDPATGSDIRPCIVSIRTTREAFLQINLSRVEKKACLKSLGAQVSPRPNELVAVRPVVDFDMVDKRFVEQGDILSSIESRPNLMDLNPFEFENLVSNLFSKIGFEAKLTRSSKDGGVDAVAFDPRPILGGKVVIQAKRHKNHVGVSAVRDLYGTMLNEGASKGILVATSHYGPDAYEFARNKPIELIDGSGLLYLLEQQGTRARIQMLN